MCTLSCRLLGRVGACLKKNSGTLKVCDNDFRCEGEAAGGRPKLKRPCVVSGSQVRFILVLAGSVDPGRMLCYRKPLDVAFPQLQLISSYIWKLFFKKISNTN